MKIAKIVFDNISYFEPDSFIEFSDRLNTLIGPNGSGKSQVLELIHRILLGIFIPHWEKKNDTGAINGVALRSKFLFEHREQIPPLYPQGKTWGLSITFEVTNEDIKAIQKILAQADEIKKYIGEANTNNAHEVIKSIDDLRSVVFHDCQKIEYKVSESKFHILNDKAGEGYMGYLKLYGLLQIWESENGRSQNPIFFSIPAARMLSSQDSTVTSSDEKQRYTQILSTYQSSYPLTRENNSLLKLMTAKLAEIEIDKQKNKNFSIDPIEESFRKLLNKFYLDYKIVWTDAYAQYYELKLYKQSTEESVMVGSASDGEKQLLNILSGLTLFGSTDGLFIIDEPELHLHGQWLQTLGTILVEEYSNCQIITATHSSSLINYRNISSIRRIYRENSKINILTPSFGDLKEKDIRCALHLFNAQNNQKIFFADKIIMVEGIYDLLFYGAILNQKRCSDVRGLAIEIIDVGGKHNFETYRKYLDLLHIKNYLIADFDYMLSNNLLDNSYLDVNYSKIWESIIDKKSFDGKKMISIMEKVVNDAHQDNLADLKKLLTYIKSRHSKLKTIKELDSTQITNLEKIRTTLEDKKIYVIDGELEDILPKEVIDNKRINQHMLLDYINDDSKMKSYVHNHLSLDSSNIINIIEKIISAA